MGYYPILLDLTDKKCLIVGGGDVALRKVGSLIEAGARVTVISPEFAPGIQQMPQVERLHRGFEEGDTSGYAVVFAATDDRDLNRQVSDEAKAAGIPVNVVDDPELCGFIVPAVVRRGDLIIAVSTSGSSPALAKRIRRELEHAYGREYGDLVDLLGSLRDEVKARYATQAEREHVFSKLVDSGILELLREGKREEARKRALQCI